MAHGRRAGSWQVAVIVALGSAWACNGILGIEAGHIEPGVGCLLNSDCSGKGNVCLFRVCSQPCKEDQDCPEDSRCLTTDNGAACTARSAATCESDDDCEGATCFGGVCRASCVDSGDCLAAQTCAQNLCFGTDPKHDSLAGGGSSASGGAGGSAPAMGGAADAAGAGGMGGPVRECETSATRCNEVGERETCSADGAWDSPVKCPFVCAADDCGGECIPGAKDCVQGITPRVCDDTGKWVASAECPAVCVEGDCKATCDIGTRQCSNKDVLLCGDLGKFEKTETCEFLCDATTKECTGECNPTAQQCSGTKLQSCGADASWQTLATCPALCTAKVGLPGQFECSGDCSPTSRRCDDLSTLQVCNSAGHFDDTNCALTDRTCYVLSTVAGCNGTCAPGQKQCSGNKVQACGATGSFSDAQTCVNQACIESGSTASCSGSCSPGQQQCLNNKQQTCNAAGDYVDSSNCTTGNKTCVKSGSTAGCEGNCSPGQTTCSANNAQQCGANGDFSLLDDCTPPDEICSAGACIPNTPYTVGNASSSSYANFDVPNDLWYVVKVTPPTTANVIALRLLGRSGTGLMRMALWRDSGGVPGAFVAQTDNTNLAAGVVSDAPVPLATKVTGGQAYWVGAKFTNSAQIYQKSQAGQTGYSFSQAFSANPSTTMATFPVGSADTFPDVALNFYLLVQDESL